MRYELLNFDIRNMILLYFYWRLPNICLYHWAVVLTLIISTFNLIFMESKAVSQTAFRMETAGFDIRPNRFKLHLHYLLTVRFEQSLTLFKSLLCFLPNVWQESCDLFVSAIKSNEYRLSKSLFRPNYWAK